MRCLRLLLVGLFALGGLLAAGCDASDPMTEDPPEENPTPPGDPDPDPDDDPGPPLSFYRLLSNHDPSPSIFNSDIWGYVHPETGREYAVMGGLSNLNVGLYIYDLADPAAPHLTAAVTGVPGFDVKTWQHYAYTVTGGPDVSGSFEGRIIDLSDPTNPRIAGSFPSSHNLFIDDQGLMYAESPGLRIFDLRTDPTNPVLIWSDGVPADGHDATVVGQRLFDFHGGAGTRLYDIADPARPQLLGTITHPQITYHHSGWPTEDGNYLFICDEAARGTTPDITVWDIRQADAPLLVASITDPDATVHNLYIKADRAYVSFYSAGFRVYDVSDPMSPTLLDAYDTAPAYMGDGFRGAWGVYPFAPSGRIYVSDIENGLFVFQPIDP